MSYGDPKSFVRGCVVGSLGYPRFDLLALFLGLGLCRPRTIEDFKLVAVYPVLDRPLSSFVRSDLALDQSASVFLLEPPSTSPSACILSLRSRNLELLPQSYLYNPSIHPNGTGTVKQDEHDDEVHPRCTWGYSEFILFSIILLYFLSLRFRLLLLLSLRLAALVLYFRMSHFIISTFLKLQWV
jgi:hypothetical protein